MASITNEVLAEKIDGITHRLVGLEKKIDEMPSAFVSHEVLELKLAPMAGKLKELDQRRNLITWGIPILATLVGSVFTYLIIEKIQ